MIDTATLAREVAQAAAGHRGRFILGITGAPASGKSTIATELAAALPGAAAVPMDGFHLDDKVLNARGDRPRKGAPHTFDVDGYCALLERLKTGEEVFAPEFDRDLELSRAAAIEVSRDVRIVVTEGNYLLYDQGGWDKVRPLLDQCWFLDVSEEELRARLTARWTHYKLSAEEMVAKIDGNDMPNARLVMETRGRADRLLSF